MSYHLETILLDEVPQKLMLAKHVSVTLSPEKLWPFNRAHRTLAHMIFVIVDIVFSKALIIPHL